jgi:hypothetical protein
VLFPINEPAERQVQRCDDCGLYEDDEAAGLALERACEELKIDAMQVVNEEDGTVHMVPTCAQQRDCIESSAESAQRWALATAYKIKEKTRKQERRKAQARSTLLVYGSENRRAYDEQVAAFKKDPKYHVKTGTRAVRFGNLNAIAYCLLVTENEA